MKSVLVGVVVGLSLLFAPAAALAASVMIGAHVGSPNDPDWRAEFTALESSIGRQLAIDSDYADWTTFPDMPRIQWDLQTGRLPMQSWRVLFSDFNPNACATAHNILSGVYDVQLAKQAAQIKSLGGTILIRFNYEMTDNQENTCFTGFPINNNLPLAGRLFIAAWKHVVGQFRAGGVTNVLWVWAPGAGAYANNQYQLFYPGSAFVDWVGMDDYNVVDTPAPFSRDPGVLAFAANAPSFGKPLIVTENAAFDDPALNPDPQTEWLTDARSFLKTAPTLVGFVYWDSFAQSPPPPPYAGSGYVLQGNGLAAFKAMANDPYYEAYFNQPPP